MSLSPGQSRLVYHVAYHDETIGHFNGDRLFTLAVNG